MKTRTTLALALALALVVASRAGALLIDFDDVASGTVVTNTYSQWGVSFNNPVGGGLVYAFGWGSAASPPNVVNPHPPGIPPIPGADAASGLIEAVFSTAQRYVSVDASFIQIIPDHSPAPSNFPRMNVYSTTGALIATIGWDFNVNPQSFVDGETIYQTLAWSSPSTNIGKVRILSDVPAVAESSRKAIFDNLQFRAQCSHALCEEGGTLPRSCDPCVASICEADPYCCQTGWDGQCVSEVASVCGSNQCAADTIELDAIDGGSMERFFSAFPSTWTETAVTGPIVTSGTYSDFPLFGAGGERHYNKFDLGALTSGIAAASLELELPDNGAAPLSSQFSQTLVLRQVTTDQTTFGFDFAAGIPRGFSFSAYTDFGDGPTYASRVITEADERKLLVIPLNAAAVTDLNAAIGGIFTIGGALEVARTQTGFSTTVTGRVLEQTGDEDTGNDPRRLLASVRRLVLTPSVCNNQVVEPGEECDDGNGTDLDGCSSGCFIEECYNGIDDDGDGVSDYPQDTGCTWHTDLSEQDPSRPCDDGVDNDDDGRADYLVAGGGDLGCRNGNSPTESPQCQDGRNNDNRAGLDFDGGDSLDINPRDGAIDGQFTASGSPQPVGSPDPQCTSAWRNAESSSCGLGFEVAPFLAYLLARRRRRASR